MPMLFLFYSILLGIMTGLQRFEIRIYNPLQRLFEKHVVARREASKRSKHFHRSNLLLVLGWRNLKEIASLVLLYSTAWLYGSQRRDN